MWFSKSKPTPETSNPFLTWSSDEHSVGVTVFDQEHERLVTLMGQIHTALQVRHDRALAQSLMASLVHQAQAHFEHEESVMDNLDFPEREAHVAEHAVLLQQANDLLQKVQNGTISALAVPSFLKTWLVPHMLNVDRKYSAYMRRNGLR